MPRPRLLLALVLVLFGASRSDAQLNLTYTTFTPQSTISSAQFTSNFTNVSDKALNRYAPVLRATLAVDTDATYDLGASGTRFRDGFFSRNVTIAGTATLATATITSATLTTLTCTGCVAATQIAADGVGADEIAAGAVGADELAATAVSVGSYGSSTAIPTFTVDADGRLTAAATVATSSLTGIVETAITDGSLLARVGANETYTGTNTFTATTTFAGIRSVDSHLALEHSTQTDWGLLNDAGSLKTYTGLIGSGTYRHTFGSDGSFTATGPLTATNGTFSGTLGVTGATTLGTATITTANVTTANVTTLNVTNNVALTGTLSSGAISLGAGTSLDAFNEVRLDGSATAATGSSPGFKFWVRASNTDYAPLEVQSGGITVTSIVTAGNIVPISTNLHDLGNTSLRFKDAWVQTGAFNGSDARLKHDIAPLTDALAMVESWVPVSYRWNDGAQTLRYGFIAQQMLAVGFPGVDTSNPESFALRYDDLIAPTVAAVQELAAQNRALEARIAALEAR